MSKSLWKIEGDENFNLPSDIMLEVGLISEKGGQEMRKGIVFFVSLVMFFSLSTRGMGTVENVDGLHTMVYQPNSIEGKDAWISSYGDDYGAGEYVGAWTSDMNYKNRGLIEFNLSGLPSSAVSAKLQMYGEPRGQMSGIPNEGDVGVYQVTSPWEEMTVSWATMPNFNGTVIDIESPDVSRWYEWDITNLYNAWKSGVSNNYGLILIDQMEWKARTGILFKSSDYSTCFHPKLVITYDATPPVSSIDLSGTPGTNGWYISDVIVSLSATDNASGIAKTEYSFDNLNWLTYTTPLTLTTEGLTTVYYRSVDNLGNVEEVKSEVVKIDKTLPTTTLSLSGTTGNEEWYLSDVAVTLSATDATSGIGTIRYRINSGDWINYSTQLKITAEGTFTLEYYTEDLAGNKEGAKSQTIKIDKTAPMLTITLPQMKDYLHSESITLNFTAEDKISGVATMTAMLDDKEVNTGDSIELIYYSLGEHTLVVKTEDKAGNKAEKTVTFNVIATIDSLITVKDKCYQLGWITNQGVMNSLNMKLENARKKINSQDFKTPANMLNAFLNEVNAQKDKHITSGAADILTADANYVIASLPKLSAAAFHQMAPGIAANSLGQNYPNPFNPATTIEYAIAEDCQVMIKLYNAAGQEVATIVDEYQYAGPHKIIFDAGERLSRGIYYYQLKAGSFVDTKKMVVLK